MPDAVYFRDDADAISPMPPLPLLPADITLPDALRCIRCRQII